MNFSQKLGLFLLILISVVYIYFSFFGKTFNLQDFGKKDQNPPEYSPLTKYPSDEQKPDEVKNNRKYVKIFILDKSGILRPVNRLCENTAGMSCFEYAVLELLAAPSKWEKSKGFASEIPQGTKLLSVRETSGRIMIDLSSEFESGGGAESTYMRIMQVIKTVNANSSVPVYLYINGKQASVIGGEGVMLKQPLNARSLNE